VAVEAQLYCRMQSNRCSRCRLCLGGCVQSRL
jgi:hypothetical protein